MKQFGTILSFELKNYLKNKVFIGVTLFLVVLIIGVLFFPRIGTMLKDEEQQTSRPVLYLLTDEADLQPAFAAAFEQYEVLTADGDEAWAKQQIERGAAAGAFIIESPTSYTYLVNNLTIYDSNTEAADEILREYYRYNQMMAAGLSAEQADEIFSAPITHQIKSFGKDQMQNFFYTYIMLFALYMVILLYGQMVATGVATEKSSRAMEVLITSARPVAMMFGKVIAACLAGLVQLGAVFGTAVLCFGVNRGYWADNPIITSVFDMPPALLGYMLLFFVLGFFIYAFLYGAIGSTASKLEDINTSVMPLTMLFIIAFFVVMMSMAQGSVDNLTMKICSFVPFTSPMAMFTRIAMSDVAGWEIGLSVGILAGSVIGVGVLSAKIYRVGVLLYGASPKLSSILKAIRKA